MNVNEQKLKRFLAGRLETEIGIYPDGNLYWVESGNYVLDTELLEICHRIEMGLSEGDYIIYRQALSRICGGLVYTIKATWQQKTTALAELFGEEI